MDRFLSHYYFYRNYGLDKTASCLDLGSYVEFYKNQKCGGVNNVLTWFLTGLIDTTVPMDELLSLAKENLAAIDFAGIVEFFPDSVDLLCLDCNWPPAIDIPFENITAAAPACRKQTRGLWSGSRNSIDTTLCCTSTAWGEGVYRINASLHTGPVHLENCFHWWEHISQFTVEGHHGPYSIGIARLNPELSVSRAGSQI